MLRQRLSLSRSCSLCGKEVAWLVVAAQAETATITTTVRTGRTTSAVAVATAAVAASARALLCCARCFCSVLAAWKVSRTKISSKVTFVPLGLCVRRSARSFRRCWFTVYSKISRYHRYNSRRVLSWSTRTHTHTSYTYSVSFNTHTHTHTHTYSRAKIASRISISKQKLQQTTTNICLLACATATTRRRSRRSRRSSRRSWRRKVRKSSLRYSVLNLTRPVHCFFGVCRKCYSSGDLEIEYNIYIYMYIYWKLSPNNCILQSQWYLYASNNWIYLIKNKQIYLY